MGDKNRYQRIFFIFGQEDAGFGTGQDPSGYAKIEVLDNKGKLTAFVQNLKEDQNRLNYKVYLLKSDEKQVLPVCAGTIPLKRNKGELLWEFRPSDVGMTGHNIEEFNIAAVLAEYKDRDNTSVVCPMVAYKSGKIKWREKLKEALYTSKIRNESTENASRKDTSVLESKHISRKEDAGGLAQAEQALLEEDVKDGNREIASNNTEDEILYEPETDVSDLNPDLLQDQEPLDITPDPDFDEKMEQSSEDVYKGSIEQIGQEETTDMLIETKPEDNFSDLKEYEKMIEKDIMEGAGEAPKRPEAIRPYPECNLHGSMVNNACANCKLVCDKSAEVKNENGLSGLDRMKKELDKYFEIYSPFATRRRDYKWWKIGSPVHLNNILYQCNIKTPLLFNPKVMMAHFKYRYIIIGIYTDRVRRREYIVCGVPGVYGVDDRAFGDTCRWVQVEGNRPKYGAFGYWIVYIDPKSGKLLSAN